ILRRADKNACQWFAWAVMVQVEFQGEGFHGEEEDSMHLQWCISSLVTCQPQQSSAGTSLRPPGGVWNNVCVPALKTDEDQNTWYRAELITPPESKRDPRALCPCPGGWARAVPALVDLQHFGDDEKLSCDEFKAYFADGILSGEELHDLFCTIIDTMLNYFSKYLGEYENVLCVLEDLNITILKAMDKTKKDYQEAFNLDQFVTRFLLRETLNQLQSLQSSLECAMETTEAQTQRGLGYSLENIHILIVQHQMFVIEEKVEEFHLALKQYVESASAQGGCLQQKLPNNFHFIVYEFWENSNTWNSHLQRNYSKAFQRSNMDFLETPELLTTMLVP
ncbi:N-terminal EF-hand calcium-binding protein 1, partial [Lamprotornis superbus]